MPVSLPVVLKNTGLVTLTVDRVDVPEGFRLWGLKRMLEGQQLTPSEEVSFEVIFPSHRSGSARTRVSSSIAEMWRWLSSFMGRAPRHGLRCWSSRRGPWTSARLRWGNPSELTFDVKNEGNAAAEIDGVTWMSTGSDASPADFAITASLPLTIAEDEHVTFTVTFSPSEAAERSDTLTLAASNHDPLAVTVKGQGLLAAGDLVCSPTQIDFGAVERGIVATENDRLRGSRWLRPADPGRGEREQHARLACAPRCTRSGSRRDGGGAGGVSSGRSTFQSGGCSAHRVRGAGGPIRDQYPDHRWGGATPRHGNRHFPGVELGDRRHRRGRSPRCPGRRPVPSPAGLLLRQHVSGLGRHRANRRQSGSWTATISMATAPSISTSA